MKGKLIMRVKNKQMSIIEVTLNILSISNIKKSILPIGIFTGMTKRTNTMQEIAGSFNTCT